MRFPRPVLLFLASAATLGAHPNHSATQNQGVTLVPATDAAPGPSEVRIMIEGDKRVITANGLPDHATGKFPNADNPNRITAQHYRFTVPAKPVANPKPTPLHRQPFGIALNGVLFDPGTAEAWQDDMESGWHYDAKGGGFSLGLDANNAHVQPNGAYHYHGIPTALLARLSGGQPALTLLGWAADGFPIYGVWGYRDAKDAASPVVMLKSSYRLKKGSRPGTDGGPTGAYDGVFVEDFEYAAGSGDLDECSGGFGVTPEFPQGSFYYVITPDFPFIPRAFRGTPDPSFSRGGPGGRRGPPPGGRPPPDRP
ncbi:MAG: YHYH protein [Lacunisphaera sp.]|nr:YHYH protein [Lacunisphaera sp.]